MVRLGSWRPSSLQEAEEPRRGANVARPQEGQDGRDGAPHPATGGEERAAYERSWEPEGTQWEIVGRERDVAHRSGGAARPGGPTTGRVDPSAEGGAPGGAPRGSPAAGDVSPLADILAHLDSEEYLDTLNQLAESLLKEIDAAAPGEAQDVSALLCFFFYFVSALDFADLWWVVEMEISFLLQVGIWKYELIK